jgi:hypothetical protein
MPNYTVRTWRPSIDAADPAEAAQLSVSVPAMDGDEFYVIENDPSGSMHYVAGSAAVVGGAYPMPQEIFKGADFTPVTPTKAQMRM